MIRRRVARLEATSSRKSRPYVVYVNEDETAEEAMARFFEPHGGETWPVAVMPKPCRTEDEWIERYASRGARH